VVQLPDPRQQKPLFINIQMNSIIVSLPKSGSSKIYTDYRKNLRDSKTALFSFYEPADLTFLRNSLDIKDVSIITKIISHTIEPLGAENLINKFENRFITIRHPFAIIVSFLFYRAIIAEDQSNLNLYISLLNRKILQRNLFSVKELHEIANSFNLSFFDFSMFKSDISQILSLKDKFEMKTIRYEDYFASASEDNISPLGWYSYIKRNGSSSDFYNWYTDDDIDFFSEYYRNELLELGYSVPEKNNVIDFSSLRNPVEYIKNSIVAKKNYEDFFMYAYTKDLSTLTSSDIDLLASRAEDGYFGEVMLLVKIALYKADTNLLNRSFNLLSFAARCNFYPAIELIDNMRNYTKNGITINNYIDHL